MALTQIQAELLTSDSASNNLVGKTVPGDLGVGGKFQSNHLSSTNQRTYKFSTHFSAGGSGTRKYRIGRFWDNAQNNWGYFGNVKIRLYDTYYSSGGWREYTITTYSNMQATSLPSITQTDGMLSGTSEYYRVTIGSAVNTGSTYPPSGGTTVNYYDIFVELANYSNCVVEVEVNNYNGAYAYYFDVSTPTTYYSSTQSYYAVEFYTDTYIQANYTTGSTGPYKFRTKSPEILAEVNTWTTNTSPDEFVINFSQWYNHWRTVECYITYYRSTGAAAHTEDYIQVRDSNGGALSCEWNDYVLKRGTGWVALTTTADVWGKFATYHDPSQMHSVKLTVNLQDPSGAGANRPSIMWESNYTYGAVGACKTFGSAHPTSGRIGRVAINLDYSGDGGVTGNPTITYMYTVVGIN